MPHGPWPRQCQGLPAAGKSFPHHGWMAGGSKLQIFEREKLGETWGNHVFPKCVTKGSHFTIGETMLVFYPHGGSCEFSRVCSGFEASIELTAQICWEIDTPGQLCPRNNIPQNHRSGWSNAKFCLVLYMCFLWLNPMTQDDPRLSLFFHCDSKPGQRQSWDPENMVCSCKSTMSVKTRPPPALNSWAPLSPRIRCVFLRKGHRSQAAPWSLEQVWVGSRKSRNFPSIQNAPRRLNDSCRSATLCGLRRFRSFRRSKSPFVRLGEQVSV